MDFKELKKTMLEMDHAAVSIKGVGDTLRTQLNILSADIKAAESGKAEYDKRLGRLETRKADLLARIKKNEEWIHTYDTEVGPFANRYKEMTSDIGIIYEKAKKGHAKGIVLLQQEFGYHPIFKHPGDTFTAIPFKPI